MNNKDTINLLKECNSGTKMAINSIDEVMDKAHSSGLKHLLQKNKAQHQRICDVTHEKLNEYHENEEHPGVIADAIAKVTTRAKLMVNSSDHEIADLMIDGCNMGIKSVSKYINEYQDSDREATRIADDLVKVEQRFMDDLRKYL